MENNTIDDLMFLFGHKKNVRTYLPPERAKIEAENAWYDNKNADDNPYPVNSPYHSLWYQTWLNCNKNC